ncbi:MAG: hypothetical protein HOP07_16200 [Bacteriovoracaceae bacterium]|nr:hypothetical protein [Bacteriovoracaceae bacterium]
MKNYLIHSGLILTLGFLLVSCSHQKAEMPQDRAVASKQCWDSVKGEYHSYFDEVEKCIEKENEK